MIPSLGRIAIAWTWTKRTAWGLALLVGVPVLALVLRAATLGLPAELRAGAGSESIRFVDRDGRVMRELRADDATRARTVTLAEAGEYLPRAILAAEDRRFFDHPGVDALAVGRAAWLDGTHARVVSGASTLTMQLARLVRPHPRTLRGKFDEAALALRIEVSLSKQEILEQYLNRAPFGAGVRGVGAASRFWFGKAPGELSLAEAATLAAIPRGPAVYAIDRHPERVLRRRDRILDRMVDAGWTSRDAAERAKREPLVARAGKGSFGAPHLVQALADGVAPLWPGELGSAPRATGAERVETTVAADLQREVELGAREQMASLASRHVSAAAVVVLENETGDVLAYVGSPDFDDPRGGQNDGVRARRQPGSTLKPFVYGLGIEKLGWTAATVLPDVPLRVPVPDGVYAPMNYDERFHGPVRLREALGSSLNVPAVWATEQIGVADVVGRLRALGLGLERADDWYGPAVALGDGEVTLLDLANAYATLARGGTWRPVRAVRGVVRPGGRVEPAPAEERRVMPEEVAGVLTDVLADPRARVAAFGAESPLDLPFDVAAKTGTSKGSRDNWTVGFTREVTVAVWVGNFDGSAMRSTSGISGAAPLFHVAMEAAMRGREPRALRLADGAPRAGTLVPADVCPLSGGRPTAACRHSVREWMPAASREALHPCGMHETVRVDRRNGLRAGPGCPEAFVVERTFERHDDATRAWAAAAGRPVAPDRYSPFCPGVGDRGDAGGGLRIGWPGDGAEFVVDPERPTAQQQLSVRVDAPRGVDRVDLLVDGQRVARVGSPFVARWALIPGDHVLVARGEGGGQSPAVTLRVR